MSWVKRVCPLERGTMILLKRTYFVHISSDIEYTGTRAMAQCKICKMMKGDYESGNIFQQRNVDMTRNMATVQYVSPTKASLNTALLEREFKGVGKCIRETRDKRNVPDIEFLSQEHSWMSSQEERAPLVPIPKSMNTYRLESRKPFHAEVVYKILKEIVKHECQGMIYDPVKCSELVMSLSDKIRNRIKLLEFERYRLVVVVEMGEKKLQGLQLVAKCLWDASRDNFATYTYQNTTLFVNATCFGIYQD